jgi:hypothetical protein
MAMMFFLEGREGRGREEIHFPKKTSKSSVIIDYLVK